MARVYPFDVAFLGSIVVAFSTVACGELTAPDEGSIEQDVVTACDQPVPASPIIFERELVIRNLHVVEDGRTGDGDDEARDHCRTTWNAACPANLQGRWTFGYMMAAMAGTSDVTSATAKTFVKNWLKLWLTDQQPNAGKDPARPRTAINETLINPWLIASGCSSADTLDTCALDLKKAPFRLLAFVNRVDLPTAAPGSGAYAAGGEFRVVFGALGFDPQSGTLDPSPLQATVILEYNFPRSTSLLTWAVRMHSLSSMDPESLAVVAADGTSSTVAYRNRLALYMEAILGPNLLPVSSSINRSAISHIRTNEIAFDCHAGTQPCSGLPPDPTRAQWEARQFKLGGTLGSTGQFLVQDTVSQTPQTADNRTPPIDNLLISRRLTAYGGNAVFSAADAALQGNSSLSPSGFGAPIVWELNVLNATNAPDLTAPERLTARHHFGFGTCNGCHYIETANQLGFFHVAPREPGTIAGISSFLSVNGAADPLASTDNRNPTHYQTVNNPTGGATIFKYNEPWRRACEIRRILTGSTTPYTKATGHLE